MFTKFADSMDNVIITLLVIKLTGSSMSTGILLAITTLPGILFSLIGGTLSDIKSQKKIISIMTALQAILLLILALFIKTNRISFAILCIILFVLESFSRLYSPAFTSATVNIASKENYKQAVSTITTVGSLVQMIGSAICATLVALIGYIPTLVVNSFSYFCSSLLSTKLNIKSNENVANTTKARDVLYNANLGLKYVINHGDIMGLIIIISMINFILAWFDVALPFLLTDFINVPIEFLGYIKSASTFMFVIAGLIMAKKKVNNTKNVISMSIAILGCSVITMSYIKNIFFSVILWGSAAFFRTIASLLLMSQLAIVSDENMIGRVMGAFMLITSISMLLSRLLSGALVTYLGASTTFKIAGFTFLILAIFSLRKLPKNTELSTT
jgi:MFS family permease